jgi:hypothetical protein
MTWIPLAYRDFYDVPRAYIIEHAGAVYFFDCPFDHSADEYPGFYRVYEMAEEDLSSLTGRGSWDGLAARGKPVGQVPVELVKFDESRRELVDGQVFELVR